MMAVASTSPNPAGTTHAMRESLVNTMCVQLVDPTLRAADWSVTPKLLPLKVMVAPPTGLAEEGDTESNVGAAHIRKLSGYVRSALRYKKNDG